MREKKLCFEDKFLPFVIAFDLKTPSYLQKICFFMTFVIGMKVTFGTCIYWLKWLIFIIFNLSEVEKKSIDF